MAVDYSVGGLAIDLKLNGYDTAMSQINELKKSLKSGGGGSGGGKSSGGVNKSITQMFNIGKFHYFVNMSKQYTRILSNMFQSAVNYNETLNLWQVAMRGNITLAEEFITKMSRSYGLAEETLMRYQATFKNMLASLGDLEDGISTKLSEVILARAIDFASLYNVSNERAMTVFQAVLSGQVRPIRSISGYDITENTIFDIYKKAGGDKTVRQLSQIEKRLLRIYAIFGQMDTSGATGDWAKQIEEPANQLRILGEQFKELGQWIGQLFLNVFAPMLPKLNAFVMTIKEITKALAQMAGYTKPNHLEGFTESINETDEAVEKLTGKLFSFDKFDVAGGSGSSSNIFGIDPTVQGLLDSMNTSIKDITMEATKLSQKWLGMVGIVYNADKGVYEITDKFKEIGKIIGTVFKILGLVGAFFLGNALISGLAKILSLTSGFKILGKAIQFAFSPLGAVLVIFGLLYSSSEEFRKSIGNLFQSLMPLVNFLVDVLVPVIKFIADLLSEIFKFVGKIGDFFGKIINRIVGKPSVGGLTGGGASARYADGGFPKQGQMFIAREAGAEMVGNIGGRTAVANNDQIVAGVAGGVREAVQPLVTIGQAIYRTIQSGGNMQINIDGQKLANNLTPRIKGNLAREGVVL